MYIKKRPEESVTIHKPAKAYSGYTLFAQHHSTDAWLIDMKGRIVHRWKLPSPPGGPIRLLPNGNQIRMDKTFKEPTAHLGTAGGKLVEVDWGGNVVWSYEDIYMHHDYCRLTNGNTLINRHVEIPRELAAKIKGGIPGTALKEVMWGNAFQEITPEGKIVWEWLGYEHMDPELDIPCTLCPLVIWGYVNGIDVLPNGDIVASFRHLNNIMIINKNTKAIKWRWGYKELGHQHNPTVLNNGNILVFDNGFHRLCKGPINTEGYSRVLEVNPKTGKIEWEYKDEFIYRFFSVFCSNAQRLANGNTLICESSKGRIFEVTSDKEIVWEFISPFYGFHERRGWTNMMFQAYRYGHEYPGLQGKLLDPDRFEFTVQERGKDETKEISQIPEETKENRRLRMLGY